VSARPRVFARSFMSPTKASVDPATCSATATAASFADAIITAFSISPSGKLSPCAR
jgi:hypothetical protein